MRGGCILGFGSEEFFYFFFQGFLFRQVAEKNATMTVGNDIGGHRGETEPLGHWCLPHTAVIHHIVADGVTAQPVGSFLTGGINADSHQGDVTRMFLLKFANGIDQHTAFVVPCAPQTEYVDILAKLFVGENPILDIKYSK